MSSGRFIKKLVFTFPGGNVKFFAAYHIVKNIGIYTGSVDNSFCGDILLISGNQVSIF